jgi:signal peptidase II
VVVIVVADQYTKSLVAAHVPLNSAVEIIPGWFDIVHARNPGAAFGILSGSTWTWRPAFFLLISGIAFAVILWFVLSPEDPGLLLLTGYALFFGGATGNFIDRIRVGEVLDFLDLHSGPYHWPAFNVADAALCAGTALFFLYFLFRREPAGRASSAADRDAERG